jgi:hypothetical protein
LDLSTINSRPPNYPDLYIDRGRDNSFLVELDGIGPVAVCCGFLLELGLLALA